MSIETGQRIQVLSLDSVPGEVQAALALVWKSEWMVARVSARAAGVDIALRVSNGLVCGRPEWWPQMPGVANLIEVFGEQFEMRFCPRYNRTGDPQRALSALRVHVTVNSEPETYDVPLSLCR